MKVMRRGKWGGPRVGAGRKAGSGPPPEEVRSQNVMVALTKAELEKLRKLAAKEKMPPSTLAYQFIARALRRRK